MSDYVPHVGDRVHANQWNKGQHLVVTYFGSRYIIGFDEDGVEQCYHHAYLTFVKVTPRPELPEMPGLWAVIGQTSDGRTYAGSGIWTTDRDALSHETAIAAVRYVAEPESVIWKDEVES